MTKHYSAQLADDESGHFEGTYGPLQSQRGRLVNVGDLVHVMTQGPTGIPLRPAAGRVLKKLEDRPDVPLFVTQPGDYAREVRPDWLKGGRSGALAKVRDHWGKVLCQREHLYPLAGRGQVAILWSDAAALFPELGISCNEGESASEPPGRPARQLVQPEGGQWPHAEGTTWTTAECEALFEMRHLLRWEDDELLKVVTPPSREKLYHRSILQQCIGPKELKADSFVGKKWEPSAELLRRCNVVIPASLFPTASAASTTKVKRAA